MSYKRIYRITSSIMTSYFNVLFKSLPFFGFWNFPPLVQSPLWKAFTHASNSVVINIQHTKWHVKFMVSCRINCKVQNLSYFTFFCVFVGHKFWYYITVYSVKRRYKSKNLHSCFLILLTTVPFLHTSTGSFLSQKPTSENKSCIFWTFFMLGIYFSILGRWLANYSILLARMFNSMTVCWERGTDSTLQENGKRCKM